jgi:hypothetical protein
MHLSMGSRDEGQLRYDDMPLLDGVRFSMNPGFVTRKPRRNPSIS